MKMTTTNGLEVICRTGAPHAGARRGRHDGDDIAGAASMLAQRAAMGDRGAFTVLMSAHKEDLYRFVRRRTLDAELAYDIVQEAFVAAWMAIGRFDPKRPFGAWLRVIALNKCRDHGRRSAVRGALEAAWFAGESDMIKDCRPSPEQDLIARDELTAVASALATLAPHLREALVLTAVDGLSHADAGAVLGRSAKSVEYGVRRARQLLVERLQREPDAVKVA